MVASQIACRGRAVAAAVLMLLVAFPLVPVTQAQDALFDITVEQGDVTLVKSGVTTRFFEANDSVTVRIRSENVGPAVSGVPIWIYLEDYPALTARCIKTSYGPGTPRDPAVVNSVDTFVLPTGLASGGHNVSVLVNRDLPAPYQAPASKDCGTVQGGVAGALDAQSEDNFAFAFFVKDHRVDYRIRAIDWCAGNPPVERSDPTSCDTVSAFTEEPDVAAPTHFRVDVLNVGTWRDTTDYSHPDCSKDRSITSDCGVLAYDVQVTLAGRGFATPVDISPGATNRTGNLSESDPGHWWHTQKFNLSGRVGNYSVSAILKNTDENLTAIEAGESLSRTFLVKYADLVPAFGSQWRTDSADPYPFAPHVTVSGTVKIRNDGARDISRNVTWIAYIDSPTSNFVRTGGNVSDTPGVLRVRAWSEWSETLTWTISSNPAVDEYLAPGLHTLHFRIDTSGETTELNETNNTIQIPIYVADESLPVFAHKPKVTGIGFTNWTAMQKVRPHEPFRIVANVTDEDPDSLSVLANISNVEDPSVFRLYPMREPAGNQMYVTHVENLSFHGNGTSTEWKVSVEATDAFGNLNVTSLAKLRMDLWPLHSVPEDYLVPDPANGARFCWPSATCTESDVAYTVYVRPNVTGIHNQTRWAPNLHMEVQPPQGKPNQTRPADHWTRDYCPQVPTDDNPVRTNNLTKEADDCPEAGRWSALVDTEAGAPGVWNVTIRVSDLGGMTRWINRTLEFYDNPPSIVDGAISAARVNSSDNLSARVRVTDDAGVRAVFVNFTRADGLNANFTMKVGDRNVDTFEQIATLNLTTGRRAMLGHAGTYNVTFLVVDTNGNWNATPPIPFRMDDLGTPSLVSAGVTPTLQEVDTNVTFFARVLDDTNVSVKLTVKRPGSDEAIVGPVEMVEGPDGNYTYATAFRQEGDYEWTIRIRDSGGNDGEPATGAVSARLNLGPRFDVRSPSSIIDGKRYGQATPRIDVFAYDNDGIDDATITFEVDGAPVTPSVLPGPAGSDGWILSYQVPNAKRYVHGATVTVNLSAIDNSTARLTGYSNFTFRVDDKAPTLLDAAFEPRHRAISTDTWNASLETRFTLGAEDDDGLPTDVASIRYTVARRTGANQVSAQIVYSGPFRLSEVPGIAALPGLYQISFFAEDSVGNVNKDVSTVTVWLDASPPYLDPYGRKPEGREVALTILDDGAGTDRAVAWHRVNNGTYAFTSMTQQGSVWKAQLPEARKGDVIVYYVQAWDLVGNTARFGTPEEPLGEYLVPNHKPTLNVTTPTQGKTLSRTVNVAWESTDVDGDDLVFTLYVKAPGSASYSEIARIETPGKRTHSLDTTKYADGDYSLRVSVHDGTDGNQADVAFSIHNSATAISTVVAGTGSSLPGEATLVTAQITKADVVAVEARVYEDGVLVDAFPMLDDGENGDKKPRDGIWSALVVLDHAGDYRIDVVATYRESGVERSDTSEGAAFLRVATTPGYILKTYMPLVALLALAGAVAIGVAAYVAFRRRG